MINRTIIPMLVSINIREIILLTCLLLGSIYWNFDILSCRTYYYITTINRVKRVSFLGSKKVVSILTFSFVRSCGSDATQCLANSECDGNMSVLATKINTFLQSVTSDFEPISPHDDFTRGEAPSVPDNRIISVDEVNAKLVKINTNKAIGPDGIPNWILRDGASFLSGPVCAVFNSSMREGYVPPMWKSANIFPLPKVNPQLFFRNTYAQSH